MTPKGIYQRKRIRITCVCKSLLILSLDLRADRSSKVHIPLYAVALSSRLGRVKAASPVVENDMDGGSLTRPPSSGILFGECRAFGIHFSRCVSCELYAPPRLSRGSKNLQHQSKKYLSPMPLCSTHTSDGSNAIICFSLHKVEFTYY